MVISHILAHDLTVGFESLEHGVVGKVNGQHIESLADLCRKIRAANTEHMRIDLLDDQGVVILQREASEAALPAMLQEHCIPSDISDDLAEKLDGEDAGGQGGTAPLAHPHEGTSSAYINEWRCEEYDTIAQRMCGDTFRSEEELAYHKERNCLLRRVSCHHCFEAMPRRDWDVHHKICPSLAVECPLACGERYLRKDLTLHMHYCVTESLYSRSTRTRLHYDAAHTLQADDPQHVIALLMKELHHAWDVAAQVQYSGPVAGSAESTAMSLARSAVSPSDIAFFEQDEKHAPLPTLGAMVKLSAAGELRFHSKPRGDNWLRPGEEGIVVDIGHETERKTVTVRCPRTSDMVYWEGEVVEVPPLPPEAPPSPKEGCQPNVHMPQEGGGSQEQNTE